MGMRGNLMQPTTQQKLFLSHTRSEIPLVCGAMYPCSNPELVASVSEAGGIGIVQPLSLVYVHGYEFEKGMRLIQALTKKPFGVNIITEKSAKMYTERMQRYVDISLEMGIRFFVTSLGNPTWVVDKVHKAGGFVYHDVTEAKWAQKALDAGVDGLIAVNNRAGGHAGGRDTHALLDILLPFGKPVLCAGGIGDENDFVEALRMGYAGVQVGTRFIASEECKAHNDYKQAIVRASENDIVLTERISGVPVAVINTPSVQKTGTQAGFLARFLLKGHKTKHWMRLFYSVRSLWQLKQGLNRPMGPKDYWQAGKSVAHIHAVEPASVIVKRFAAALRNASETPATTTIKPREEKKQKRHTA